MRFVILFHETPPNFPRPAHWDLMLETGRGLRTWALGREPAIGSIVPAESLPDHRLEYLDYEGPISRGRGTVKRWDAGLFEILEQTADAWRVRLHGRHLQCVAVCSREANDANRWQIAFATDDRGHEDSGLSEGGFPGAAQGVSHND